MSNRMAPRWILAACLATGFLGGAAFFMTIGASTHAGGNAPAPATPVVSPEGKELLTQFSAAFETAAARVNPSVVPIMSEQVTHVSNPF
ncbi:MAG TPA: hypothetical protein VMM80_04455, partial [Bacteroidota bacterium]|nr:hypothetical protein [Bacteroidota bacterium]